MGREVRRVPADFNWPLNKVWHGFKMPDELHSQQCYHCGGQGVNAATRVLSDSWYDQAGFVMVAYQFAPHITDAEIAKMVHDLGGRWTYRYGQDRNGNVAERPPWKIIGDYRGWQHDLTQDEVQLLFDEGRFYRLKEKGVCPTAAEINEAYQHGMGHDAINMWICVKARAQRMGIYGHCEHCKGEGRLWRDEEHKRLNNEWESTPPPEGPAYQIWETVSEGSPVSPAFMKPEDLARWMVRNDSSVTSGTTFDGWVKFITKVGFAPSAIGVGDDIKSGVQALTEEDDQ